ncbi:hypothetical protein BDV27DRAFT_134894 [Aspergillus caelatus]|uniref:Uncharacterized protein n=1 Tax=Aspergillus caelatus TaxID=61420 RepID=A0A5N6ZS08_9EURO|nr:uncharacterized protein BDV27DRAFT_134894 [Aspergillus caelatus]KAE8360185.1 hypothetical protein BDV27DRAFT_134894 [Aspergillus caelatus]
MTRYRGLKRWFQMDKPVVREIEREGARRPTMTLVGLILGCGMFLQALRIRNFFL